MADKPESGDQINFDAVARFARWLQTTDAPEPLQKLAEAYVVLYTKSKKPEDAEQSRIRSEASADPAA